jgi:hypothetical protein
MVAAVQRKDAARERVAEWYKSREDAHSSNFRMRNPARGRSSPLPDAGDADLKGGGARRDVVGIGPVLDAEEVLDDHPVVRLCRIVFLGDGRRWGRRQGLRRRAGRDRAGGQRSTAGIVGGPAILVVLLFDQIRAGTPGHA